MTRIRVDDAREIQGLIDSFVSRPDCVCTQLDGSTVEVSLLGSLAADAHRLEIELRLRAWQAAHPEIRVRFLD